MSLENFVRQLETPSLGPQRYYPPGVIGVPPVRRSVGLRGGTKTFNYSLDVTTELYMAQINTESAPNFSWPLAGG